MGKTVGGKKKKICLFNYSVVNTFLLFIANHVISITCKTKKLLFDKLLCDLLPVMHKHT